MQLEIACRFLLWLVATSFQSIKHTFNRCLEVGFYDYLQYAVDSYSERLHFSAAVKSLCPQNSNVDLLGRGRLFGLNYS